MGTRVEDWGLVLETVAEDATAESLGARCEARGDWDGLRALADGRGARWTHVRDAVSTADARGEAVVRRARWVGVRDRAVSCGEAARRGSGALEADAEARKARSEAREAWERLQGGNGEPDAVDALLGVLEDRAGSRWSGLLRCLVEAVAVVVLQPEAFGALRVVDPKAATQAARALLEVVREAERA